jgi:hypothetical protein
MLTQIVALISMSQPAPVVTDYFPVEVGSKWVYTDTLNKIDSKCEDSVVAKTQINGQELIGIHSKIDERHFETTYYRVDSDRVMLMGFDPKKLLAKPYAVFAMATKGEMKWTHNGETMIFDELAPMTMKCSAKPLGSYKFKGQVISAIEVRLNAEVDLGPKTKATSEQVAIYGKGIGLIELRETGKYGRQKFARIRTLQSYSIGGDAPK